LKYRYRGTRMIDEQENKRKIKVKIYGKEYSIKSTEEPEYVEEIARYVDSKMMEVDRSGNPSNPVQVAVLAAMNITDELFAERNRESKTESNLDERSKDLAERISSVLEPE